MLCAWYLYIQICEALTFVTIFWIARHLHPLFTLVFSDVLVNVMVLVLATSLYYLLEGMTLKKGT